MGWRTQKQMKQEDTTKLVEEAIESLFTRLIAGFIEFREDFKFRKVFSGDRLTNYNIICNAADCPRVLGKGGERFRALRYLMERAGEKLNRQISLETMESPVVGKPKPFPKFRYNPKWPRKEVEKLLADTCEAVFTHPVKIELRESMGSAIFVVKHSDREFPVNVAQVAVCLQNIFRGVGTTNGCQIAVDVGVDDSGEE